MEGTDLRFISYSCFVLKILVGLDLLSLVFSVNSVPNTGAGKLELLNKEWLNEAVIECVQEIIFSAGELAYFLFSENEN